jgi:hypothetical protein
MPSINLLVGACLPAKAGPHQPKNSVYLYVLVDEEANQ